MPLIAAIKNTLSAAFLAMILAVVGTANAASHLPDCKVNPTCLIDDSIDWETVNATDMQAMINAGAYINATTDNGLTPLYRAAFHGTAEVIPILLQAGADVNAKNNNGWTPLHTAAAQGHAEVIPILVKAGADVNAKNNNGSTPLGIAEPTKNSDVISALKSAGAKSRNSKYERKRLSIDGLVEYNFVSYPQCRTSRDCVVIEAKAIQGCPRSLYMNLILFDGQNRNIGFTNAVAHDLRKGESALLEFSIIEKNTASYRVGKINCHQ